MEDFSIKSFKIPKENLKKNEIKFTSKDEVVEQNLLTVDSLPTKELFDGNHYLFLISSNYLDNKDGDNRGNLRIPSKDEFKDNVNLFSQEEILLDDIKETVNEKVIVMYPEIAELQKKQFIEVEELKKMFLLNGETIKSLSVSLNDTEENILEKVYVADAKIEAEKDAKIKKNIEKLNKLDPTSNDFEKEFDKTISDLVKQIPLQNRVALTHYVARRKLVLDLFQLILKKELQIQDDSKRNFDEKLLHNLIIPQGSKATESSDLWLLNEDFIYFNGTSEEKLADIQFNGEKIFKETLTDEELAYRDSLGEKRYEKRPDVLLFPSEGKCVIIEFKNPDKNVSDHLLQIQNYASLIRNLTKDDYNFTTFYGYLIGEKVDADDIQNKDSAFVNAYHFDYVFKPHYRIIGKFGRTDGSLYTEAIKYSTILDRASKRNGLFIKKLGIDVSF